MAKKRRDVSEKQMDLFSFTVEQKKGRPRSQSLPFQGKMPLKLKRLMRRTVDELSKRELSQLDSYLASMRERVQVRWSPKEREHRLYLSTVPGNYEFHESKKISSPVYVSKLSKDADGVFRAASFDMFSMAKMASICCFPKDRLKTDEEEGYLFYQITELMKTEALECGAEFISPNTFELKFSELFSERKKELDRGSPLEEIIVGTSIPCPVCGKKLKDHRSFLNGHLSCWNTLLVAEV